MSSKFKRPREDRGPSAPRLDTPKYNRWSCGCGYSILTVEHVDGVTPFLMPCGSCKMMTARSHFYKVTLGPGEKPNGEWRMPTAYEYHRLSDAVRHHVDSGGLNYYPNSGAQPSEN